ncbi:hypothetical protein N7533_000255 [Penicillium manginii]|jgi:hypothetical protein|uniref:uncharacterized protein n=1 Tax=Penicillium manginii TaxID=203109 RepID=UPI0025482B56|nr:uncharacterized protein N7533_000255 [Penicillium manginii]KAJ5767672.1 hypothetical protein N7533_000255 [Penicillium manginii]
MRSDDLAAQTRHCDGFETPMDVSNEQLQPFTMNRSTGSEGSEVQHSFHLADTNSNDLEPPSELGASDPVTIDIPQDYDWYSFSFTEAGVAQFDGVEPSSLFQQGWQMFG